MSRRPAATLVEVLVAIFVMGIGLIALLTLFPLGIISMALAIQEERAYQCALIASNLANAVGLRYDPFVLQDWQYNPTSPYPTGNLGGNDIAAPPNQVLDAYTNPYPAGLPSADPNGPSYPLFVDPVGYYTSAVNQNWVGGQVGILARRRVSFTRAGLLSTTAFNPFPNPLVFQPSPPFPPNTPVLVMPPYPAGGTIPDSSSIAPPGMPPNTAIAVPAYPQPFPYPPPTPSGTTQALLNEALMSEMFTLWDDIVIDSANPGMAATAGGTLLRDTRFSWAYVCQRPQNGTYSGSSSFAAANRNADNGSAAIVNLSVVVFNKRPLALGTTLSLPENIYDAGSGNPTYFDPVKNAITIDYTNNVPPPLRPGDWILDVTKGWTVNTLTVSPTLPSNGVYTPHGNFYRVVSSKEFEDTVAGAARQFVQYEVQQSLRGYTDKNGVPVFPVTTAPPWPAPTPPGPVATTTGSGANLGYAGTSIVFDGVVRVFEFGAGRNR